MSTPIYDYQFWSVVGSFAIAGATVALTVSTAFLVKSSRRHEQLIEAQTQKLAAQTKEIQIQTQTLAAPRIAIRGVTRVTAETAFVSVANVGLGTAEHIKVTVSWAGSDILQLPEGRWFYLGPSESRNLHFKLPEKVETVDVRVNFEDLLGKKLENDVTNATVRRLSAPMTVSRV